MRPTPNAWFRLAVTLAIGVQAGLMLMVVGASALERTGTVPLVAAGAALATLVLAVLRLARRSAGRSDLDRELRQLLEEEAGKTP